MFLPSNDKGNNLISTLFADDTPSHRHAVQYKFPVLTNGFLGDKEKYSGAWIVDFKHLKLRSYYSIFLSAS